MDTKKNELRSKEALHIGGVVRSYTEEEIRRQAKDFCNKWLPKWEKYCEVCGACNCKNNDSCIKCNCQF